MCDNDIVTLEIWIRCDDYIKDGQLVTSFNFKEMLKCKNVADYYLSYKRDYQVALSNVKLQNGIFEMDLPYEFLAIKVNRSHLVAHELLF